VHRTLALKGIPEFPPLLEVTIKYLTFTCRKAKKGKFNISPSYLIFLWTTGTKSENDSSLYP